MAIRQLKDGRWIVYYRTQVNGKPKQVSEYFGRGADGEAAARKRNKELDLKPRRPARTVEGMSFWELAEAYVKNKNFSPNSKKHLLIRLEANILPFFGNRSAMGLTDIDMDKYVRKRVKDQVKFSTITRELTDVKAILNWSSKRNPPLIPYNPVRDYQKPTPDDAIILPPTQEETERILQAASPHMLRAILLSYYLGLRPGAVELLSITWDRMNWENQSIRIFSAHKGGPLSRQVPIHEDLLAYLKTWYQEDIKNFGRDEAANAPIIHYHGKPIKKIQTAWEKTLERAGINRRLRPYDLRHHFVTRALEEGADIKALSDIVGSRPETLMRHYQHVTNELHRRTVAKIPKVTILAKKRQIKDEIS